MSKEVFWYVTPCKPHPHLPSSDRWGSHYTQPFSLIPSSCQSTFTLLKELPSFVRCLLKHSCLPTLQDSCGRLQFCPKLCGSIALIHNFFQSYQILVLFTICTACFKELYHFFWICVQVTAGLWPAIAPRSFPFSCAHTTSLYGPTISRILLLRAAASANK